MIMQFRFDGTGGVEEALHSDYKFIATVTDFAATADIREASFRQPPMVARPWHREAVGTRPRLP